MITSTLDLSSTKAFLKIAQDYIKKGNFILYNRNSIDIGSHLVNTTGGLLDLGVTLCGVKDIICDLDCTDCIRVSDDYNKAKDENMEVFEFLKMVNSIKTYIKLTADTKRLKCLSFHRSNPCNEY